MGMGMALFDYLAEKRLIKRGSRILDIGSQNLYNATPETVRSFVGQFGRIDDEAKLAKEAERIAYFSTPRPGNEPPLLPELIDLVDIEYLADTRRMPIAGNGDFRSQHPAPAGGEAKSLRHYSQFRDHGAPDQPAQCF